MRLPSSRQLLIWAAEHYLDLSKTGLPIKWHSSIPESEEAGRFIEDYSYFQYRTRSVRPGLTTINDINDLAFHGKQLLMKATSPSDTL